MNTCACGWEIPIIYADLDDKKPSKVVIVACACCGCPHRVKVRKPE